MSRRTATTLDMGFLVRPLDGRVRFFVLAATSARSATALPASLCRQAADEGCGRSVTNGPLKGQYCRVAGLGVRGDPGVADPLMRVFFLLWRTGSHAQIVGQAGLQSKAVGARIDPVGRCRCAKGQRERIMIGRAGRS